MAVEPKPRSAESTGVMTGRVAVITAAASGMGRQSALLFASEGAHVVAVDINGDGCAAVAEEIAQAGGSAEALTVDMTDLGQIEAAIRTVDAGHGRIDVLFNHAGAAGPRGFDFDAEAWQRSVDINLTAPVFMTKAAWPLLQKVDAASIIFTSSVSGLIASRNSPVYATVKTGLIGFMRCMAAVGGPDNIRSNAICPGATDTPMLNEFFAAPGEDAGTLEARLESFKLAVPLGRFCKPEEAADLALFLASDRSSFITGVAIPIDGGYVAL